MCHVVAYEPLLYLSVEHGRLNSGIFYNKLMLVSAIEENSNFETYTQLLA